MKDLGWCEWDSDSDTSGCRGLWGWISIPENSLKYCRYFKSASWFPWEAFLGSLRLGRTGEDFWRDFWRGFLGVSTDLAQRTGTASGGSHFLCFQIPDFSCLQDPSDPIPSFWASQLSCLLCNSIWDYFKSSLPKQHLPIPWQFSSTEIKMIFFSAHDLPIPGWISAGKFLIFPSTSQPVPALFCLQIWFFFCLGFSSQWLQGLAIYNTIN